MMKNCDGKGSQSSRSKNVGLVNSSVRAISGYLRIMQSGASTVARTAASVASSIKDREGGGADRDQLLWAGFDKLDGKTVRRVLLLGYRSGFQVWDVEEANNVHIVASRNDGPVSFMQLLHRPITPEVFEDKFADSRPLLVVCADASFSGGNNIQNGVITPLQGGIYKNGQDQGNGNFVPTVVQFYSLRTHSFVHMIKFRSVVYTVRCSSRVVAVSLTSQIHCFDVATLEMVYTILTNPIVTSNPGAGGVGYGPLAIGPRWIAYSGSPVVSESGNLSPQHFAPSANFPVESNGSLVAHYARESSKQLAAGIVTLGDMGYKKLSSYCSELLPDNVNSLQMGCHGQKGRGYANGQTPDTDTVGMVIVRDIVDRSVIAQFKAHKSPISALCFDSSGTLLVTASVQGHNINVFRILPREFGTSPSSAGASYVHLYTMQRGFTNAVIQDISFSNDSNWIVISSSKGTSHIFAVNPFGGPVNFLSTDGVTSKNSGLGIRADSVLRWPPHSTSSRQSVCAPGSPVTLSAVSRIRNGSQGWTGAVSGAAAAATGRANFLTGAIASSFLYSKGNDLCVESSTLRAKFHLLVFSPSGCMIQYGIKTTTGFENMVVVPGLSNTNDLQCDVDGRLIIEAIQKWDICRKQCKKNAVDNIDIYGENGNSDGYKMLSEGIISGFAVESKDICTGGKSKISPEEHRRRYMSEAELQTHRPVVPLWAKPRVCFQSIMTAGIQMEEANAEGGEIEIEQHPTSIIEAKSKNLIPVNPLLDDGIAGLLLHQRSEPSENVQLPQRSSSGSLNSVSESSMTFGLHKKVQENGWDDPETEIISEGFVSKSLSSETLFKTVNNRENSEMGTQLKFVNNSKGLKVENTCENGSDQV